MKWYQSFLRFLSLSFRLRLPWILLLRALLFFLHFFLSFSLFLLRFRHLLVRVIFLLGSFLYEFTILSNPLFHFDFPFFQTFMIFVLHLLFDFGVQGLPIIVDLFDLILLVLVFFILLFPIGHISVEGSFGGLFLSWSLRVFHNRYAKSNQS